MIKQTITYTGFDDKEHTGDFYFHLSTSELLDLEAETEGGMSDFLTKTAASGDAQKIIKEFKRIISAAYGDRLEDGSFEKDESSTAKFMKSPAFDQLFLELITDPKRVTEFINGIVPKGLVEQLNKAGPVDSELPWANREPTPKELTEMSKDQLLAVFKRRSQQDSQQ